MTVITQSPEETEALGYALAGKLRPGAVLAFTGDLGAGKTTLIRGMAKGLGIETLVTSPTYTIVNEYESGRIPLIHFDMYRLTSAEELFEIGWEDYSLRGAVLAVEWSEHVTEAFGPDTVYIQMEKAGETDRKITIIGLAGEA